MIFKLLLIFCAYIPFQIALNPKEGIDLASLRVFVIILLLFWVFKGLKKRKIIILPAKETIFILLFLFFVIFSLFFASNPEWGLRKVFFIFSFAPLYFVIGGSVFREEQILSMMRWLTLGGFFAALIGIFQFFLQFFIGVDRLFLIWSKVIGVFLGKSFSQAVLENNSWLVNLGGETVFRLISFFPDPHIAAFYFGMLVFVSMGLFLENEDKKRKKVYLGIFIVLLLADFLTFSRGGYLGVLGASIFFGVFFLKEVEFKKLGRILAICVMMGVIVFALGPVRSRLLSSFDIAEGSNSERIKTWAQSLSVSKNNYWTGVGIGNYPLEIKPSALWREPIYSHNLYLDLLAESGLFGLLSWMALILGSLWSLLRWFLRDGNFVCLGIASSLVVFLVHSFFETALFSIHILTLLMIFISSSAILGGKENAKGSY